jgi:hypothetical protein
MSSESNDASVVVFLAGFREAGQLQGAHEAQKQRPTKAQIKFCHQN